MRSITRPIWLLAVPALLFAGPDQGSRQASDQTVTVIAGTKIPLSMVNSVSTKHAAEGDRIYLETVFPIVVNGRVVIPPRSYVTGTVTQVKRPGKVKGKGELYVRFDTLILPNGTTRDFRARIGQLDGRATEELDKSEGKIKSDSTKGADAQRIGELAGAGASVGAIGGGLSGHSGMGVGVGAAAGAAAGLATVLLTRGPDAVLAKGTTLEMVLDRPLVFDDKDLDMSSVLRNGGPIGEGPGPLQKQTQGSVMGRRLPY